MDSNAPDVIGDDKRQAEETVKSYSNDNDEGGVSIRRKSSVLNVVVAGLALFSDGYNAQISQLSIRSANSRKNG